MYDFSCRACQSTSTNLHAIGENPKIREFFELVQLKTFDDSQFLCQKCKDFTMNVMNFIDTCKKAEAEKCEKQVLEVQELKIPSCSQEEVIVETNEDFESFNIDYNTSDIAEIDILSNNSVEVPNLISYGVDLPRECSETPGKDPKFICEYCGNAYHKKDSLKQHLLTHQVYPSEKRRIHKCFHCDAEFYYFSTYKIHINNVHNQNRPYQCHLCEKSYKKKDSLDQHVLMHQNRRKYRCPTCNSSFNRNSDLKYHMRVHGERNLYTCHLCEAKYVSLANLKLHLITIHEGKRPWTCQNCTNAFRTKATMLKHTKAMTCVKKME